MSLEASRRLEGFLNDAIKELGGSVADVGAKKGVQSLSETMAEVKAMIAGSLDRSKAKIIQQGQKMAAELEANSDLVVQKMEEHHQDAMTQFNDLLGNERAGDHSE